MTDYVAPLAEMRFVLDEKLRLRQYFPATLRLDN